MSQNRIISNFFSIYCFKDDLQKQKLEVALREERNRLASFEYQFELTKKKISKLEAENRHYRNKENEYDSIKKTYMEQEEKFQEQEIDRRDL